MRTFKITSDSIIFDGDEIECEWNSEDLLEMRMSNDLVILREFLIKIYGLLDKNGFEITDEEEEHIKQYAKKYFLNLKC